MHVEFPSRTTPAKMSLVYLAIRLNGEPCKTTTATPTGSSTSDHEVRFCKMASMDECFWCVMLSCTNNRYHRSHFFFDLTRSKDMKDITTVFSRSSYRLPVVVRTAFAAIWTEMTTSYYFQFHVSLGVFYSCPQGLQHHSKVVTNLVLISYASLYR